MFVFKIVTTTLLAILLFIIAFFCFSLRGKDQQMATYIGFTLMMIVEIMAIVCIWG